MVNQTAAQELHVARKPLFADHCSRSLEITVYMQYFHCIDFPIRDSCIGMQMEVINTLVYGGKSHYCHQLLILCTLQKPILSRFCSLSALKLTFKCVQAQRFLIRIAYKQRQKTFYKNSIIPDSFWN